MCVVRPVKTKWYLETRIGNKRMALLYGKSINVFEIVEPWQRDSVWSGDNIKEHR